ncbi:hypothetical protein RJ639_020850 [Escallonia herrerae]|uniref:Pentatricopeptide repeat-containing protein n=1 Tax=Escallonia herrerae TaxID=1293975 RepID=A0AA88V3T8_9ASTE|nr:hypothetical protein RJ639_020850 [Escallonia herrerae]
MAWSAMISGYSQASRCKEALLLFHEMQKANVEPNEVWLTRDGVFWSVRVDILALSQGLSIVFAWLTYLVKLDYSRRPSRFKLEALSKPSSARDNAASWDFEQSLWDSYEIVTVLKKLEAGLVLDDHQFFAPDGTVRSIPLDDRFTFDAFHIDFAVSIPINLDNLLDQAILKVSDLLISKFLLMISSWHELILPLRLGTMLLMAARATLGVFLKSNKATVTILVRHGTRGPQHECILRV